MVVGRKWEEMVDICLFGSVPISHLAFAQGDNRKRKNAVVIDVFSISLDGCLNSTHGENACGLRGHKEKLQSRYVFVFWCTFYKSVFVIHKYWCVTWTIALYNCKTKPNLSVWVMWSTYTRWKKPRNKGSSRGTVK